MPSASERSLQILELMAGHERGLPLHRIADTLDMPRSAAHRLLAELTKAGFVHQTGEPGNYELGLKLVALGLRHLAANDLVGLSRPVLDELAATSSELVRLAVIDGEEMVWVSTSQGARSGLRYDPDSGSVVTLSCSATGWAWMASIPETEALRLILRQGIKSREDFAPNAPQDIDEIRQELAKTRERGYAIAIDTHSVGIGSVAAPVYNDGEVAGVLSIAGPTARLDFDRLTELSKPLLEAVFEISRVFEVREGMLRPASA